MAAAGLAQSRATSCGRQRCAMRDWLLPAACRVMALSIQLRARRWVLSLAAVAAADAAAAGGRAAEAVAVAFASVSTSASAVCACSPHTRRREHRSAAPTSHERRRCDQGGVWQTTVGLLAQHANGPCICKRRDGMRCSGQQVGHARRCIQPQRRLKRARVRGDACARI